MDGQAKLIEVWLKQDNSSLGTLTTNTEGNYSSGGCASSFDDIYGVRAWSLMGDHKRGNAFLDMYVLVFIFKLCLRRHGYVGQDV